ncbi:radical SAM protein [Intestinibacter sp.]
MEDLFVPNSICWNITHKCNEKCEFCYRDNVSEDLLFEENKKILDSIIESGVKKITFAGGEPLMYPSIIDLVKYAKQNDMITSMTTNSILLSEELLLELDGILDWITFPLDAPSSELQIKMTRNKNHFNKVLQNLELIKSNNLLIRPKINTVVSKINKDEIKNMTEIIEKYNILRWKLFQFVPLRGAADINSYKFYITNKEYHRVKEDITKNKNINKSTIITFTDRNSLESSYFVVFPNGDVRISTDLDDKFLGNLKNDTIKDIWKNRWFDKNSHINRTNRSIEISNLELIKEDM